MANHEYSPDELGRLARKVRAAGGTLRRDSDGKLYVLIGDSVYYLVKDKPCQQPARAERIPCENAPTTSPAEPSARRVSRSRPNHIEVPPTIMTPRPVAHRSAASYTAVPRPVEVPETILLNQPKPVEEATVPVRRHTALKAVLVLGLAVFPLCAVAAFASRSLFV